VREAALRRLRGEVAQPLPFHTTGHADYAYGGVVASACTRIPRHGCGLPNTAYGGTPWFPATPWAYLFLPTLLDHLISLEEERRWHGEVECLGGLEVDDQLEFRGPLHLQCMDSLGLCPPMLIGLGEPAPPDFIAKAQRPRGLGLGPLDQQVPPFFLRA
jgi:hypothetical protein